MIRVFVATVFLGWLVFPALAASLDAAAINNAEYSSKLSTDSIEAAAIRVQVLLDRAQFSPGEIDGKLGENAEKALKAFAEAKGLRHPRDLTRMSGRHLWPAAQRLRSSNTRSPRAM